MSYYAKIVNNVVEQVIVADAEVIKSYDGDWVETFMDDPIKSYAGIGHAHDGLKFIPPPSSDALWDGKRTVWVDPVKMEEQIATLTAENESLKLDIVAKGI